MAALLVGYEAIFAREVGAAAGLARAESVVERNAKFLHHCLVVPYQTDS